MAFTSDNLAVFLAVLDTGSFSAAGRRLGRVPSAVSMAIANLEAELALTLFDRSGREPRATASAKALEPQARLMAGQLQALNSQALALSQGLESRLTVVIAPELQSTHWVAPLQDLAAAHPTLEVQVVIAPQADALHMLHSAKAQLAVVFERPSMDGREAFQEIGRERLLAVIAPSHPLLRNAPLDQAFRDTDLLAVRQIAVTGRDVETLDPRFSIGRHCWRTDSPEAALKLIEAELGWGWLPASFVAPHVACGAVRTLNLANLTNGTDLCVDLVWSRERPLALGARQFIDAVVRAQTGRAG